MLPSRVVENLFWMGRYAERGEVALRLLRTLFLQLNGVEPLSDGARRLLLRTVTLVTHTRPGFCVAAAPFARPEAELRAVALDGARPGTVTASLNAMLQAGRRSRNCSRPIPNGCSTTCATSLRRSTPNSGPSSWWPRKKPWIRW